MNEEHRVSPEMEELQYKMEHPELSVDGDPFLNAESEQRAWDEHKDECNGCALCEL